jgi:hypothetical protein
MILKSKNFSDWNKILVEFLLLETTPKFLTSLKIFASNHNKFSYFIIKSSLILTIQNTNLNYFYSPHLKTLVLYKNVFMRWVQINKHIYIQKKLTAVAAAANFKKENILGSLKTKMGLFFVF